MSGITFSEYVHSDTIHTDQAYFSIHYEPFEHNYAHGIAGRIYFGTTYSGGFLQFEDGTFRHDTEHHADAYVKWVGLANYDNSQDGRRFLIIEWSKDPGEHFLGVDYMHGRPPEKLELKANWRLEGF